VIAEPLLDFARLVFLIFLEREHLRGAGLARELVLRADARLVGRASGRHGALHAVVDDLPLLVGGEVHRRHHLRCLSGDLGRAGRAHAGDEARHGDDLALLRDLRGEMRLLQRRHRDRSLPDTHADGFAGKPHLIRLLFEGALLPLR